MEIIAHRGNHDLYLAPENTLEAIKHAWDLNVDGVEIDIRLTGDMQIVVFHDAQTGGLTDGNLTVCNSRLNELKELSITGRDRSFPPLKYRIPALEEVIVTIPPDKSMFIEIKHNCDPEGKIINVLHDLLNQYKISKEQIVFIGYVNNSIEFFKMKRIKERFKDHKVFPIFNFDNLNSAEEIIKKAVLMKADGINIGNSRLEAFKDFEKRYRPINNFMKKFYRQNLCVNIWALDDPVMAGIFADAGVSSITTNMPGLISQSLPMV